ncbi:MAG: hypothetical protein IJF77_07860 [Alistipes sp.]|nr:hypothetical protein [Alistipes sp.]
MAIGQTPPNQSADNQYLTATGRQTDPSHTLDEVAADQRGLLIVARHRKVSTEGKTGCTTPNREQKKKSIFFTPLDFEF